MQFQKFVHHVNSLKNDNKSMILTTIIIKDTNTKQSKSLFQSYSANTTKFRSIFGYSSK